MRHLSKAQCHEIILQNYESVPLRETFAEFGVSRATYYRVSNKFSEGTIGRRPNTPRAPSLTEDDRVELKEKLEQDPYLTINELKDLANLSVSPSTISRACKQIGLPSRLSTKKFLISHINREKRVLVARARLQWDDSILNSIVYTYESGIDNSGLHYRRVRRPKGTRFEEKYTCDAVAITDYIVFGLNHARKHWR